MATLDHNATVKNLLKKGFKSYERDHTWLCFYYKEEFILGTKVSHGSNHEIDNNLISKMSQQCKVDKKFFIEFARCHKSKEEYIEALKKNQTLN